MDTSKPLQDETLAAWLEAMPASLQGSLGVSPVRMTRGLQDGSLRALWKRESARMPRVDSGRLELWADWLLEYALERLDEDENFHGVKMWAAAPEPDRRGVGVAGMALRLLTPVRAMSVSVALRDDARGRVVQAHAQIANEQDAGVFESMELLVAECRSPRVLKCLLQVQGILAARADRHHDSLRYYLASNEIAQGAKLEERELATSRINALLGAMTVGDKGACRDAIELINRMENLTSTFVRECVKRTLGVHRVECTIDLQLLQRLESQMSPGTRELIHEIT